MLALQDTKKNMKHITIINMWKTFPENNPKKMKAVNVKNRNRINKNAITQPIPRVELLAPAFNPTTNIKKSNAMFNGLQ
jgi:hypothetical protein